MTTKAELEIELEKLRARNAELKAQANQKPEHDEVSQNPSPVATKDEIRKSLEEHGIDLKKIETMGDEVIEEFHKLQEHYPIAVLAVAFTLGYVVGRVQK